jgi:hypothetical protein
MGDEESALSRAQGIYEDPKLGLWADARLLARRSGASLAEAKDFIRDSEVAQLHHRAARPPLYAPTGGPAGTYLADIVFYEDISKVNRGYKAILVMLNANTRMAYAEPLKKKSDAPAAFELILDRVAPDFAPQLLITDADSVFLGKPFQSVLRSWEISHETVVASQGEHARLGRIDRFIRTLRTLVGRWQEVSGGDNYVDLLENYKNKDNRATGLAPAETTLAGERASG